MGRRAHRRHGKDQGSQKCQPDTNVLLDALSGHEPEEKELLSFLLSQPGSLDHFVVCPSFQAEQQRSLAVQLPTALPLFKDAFLACAVTLKHLRSRTADDLDVETSIRYISKAVIALRSLSVSCPQDAAICHELGSLLAFSIHSAIGVGVADICRYCLSATSPFALKASSDTPTDPWQSFLVYQETMDCILYRQKPTLRIELPAFPVVDQRLGLSLPLLPYYQDLCLISNSILNATDATELARLQKQLDDIRCIVEPWQPSNMDRLFEKFDSAEIIHLLAQAKLYRLGALLLGHRLRFPFWSTGQPRRDMVERNHDGTRNGETGHEANDAVRHLAICHCSCRASRRVLTFEGAPAGGRLRRPIRSSFTKNNQRLLVADVA